MSTGRSLKLEVLLQAVDRVTRPFRSIMGSGSELARTVKAARDQLKELNRVQVNIDSFRKLSKDAAITENQLRAAQLRVKALAQEMAAADRPSAALSRNFQAAVREAQGFKQRGAELQQSLQGVRARLDAAGVSTTNLGTAQRELRGQVASASQALAQQEAHLKAVGERHRRISAAEAAYGKGMASRNAMLGAGASSMAAGGAVLAPIAKAVKDYVHFEDAMLGIARQVPGARDDAGKLTDVYFQMAAQIKRLGEELPIPTTAIAEMVTAGARMEVPKEELIEYTRTVAMMATAFDAVPDEIAESMGKVAKNFKIPTNGIKDLADAINYLDDNAISKGADIINVLNRISGVVSTVKMSSGDAAALASTLLTLGERPETAATAINAITQKFAAAEKGSKKFRYAVADIGLSTQAIQKGMATDATGTLFKVIEAVRKMPKDQRIGIMVDLVGMEHSDTLAKLVDKPDEFQRQLDMIHGGKEKGSMEKEFSARQQTISAAWARLQNKLFNSSATAGEVMRPVVGQMMDSISGLIDRFNAFTQAHPAMVAWLFKGAAAAGVLLTVFGGLTLALAAMLGPLVISRYGLSMLGIRLGSIGADLPKAASGFNLLSGAASRFTGMGAGMQASATKVKAALAAAWQGSSPTAAWSALQGYTRALSERVPAASKAAWLAVRHWGAGAATSLQGGISAVRQYTAQLWQATAAQAAASRAAAASRWTAARQYAGNRGAGGVAADAAKGGINIIRSGAVGLIEGARAGLARLAQILLFVGRIALTNPIGLLIAALVVGAMLIIKYWEPIKAFFAGVWQGLTEGLAPLSGTFGQVFAAIGSALAPLQPVFDWLVTAVKGVWDWITRLLGPVSASKESLDAATASGRGFGQWLASVIVVAAQVVAQFAMLPVRFVEIGVQIMQGLVNGITSMVGSVVQAVSSTASSLVGTIKEKLGIHSPSRVFAELGGFTMAGLEQGLSESQGGPLQAISRVASGLIDTGAAGLKDGGASLVRSAGRIAQMLAGAGTGIAIGTAPALASVLFDTRPPLARPAATTSNATPIAQAPIVINIHPPAGADEHLIARLVEEKLRQIDSQRAARERSRLTDRD